MPNLDDPNDEVLRSLDARAAALQKTTARPEGGDHGRAVDQAYRLIAELLGGVLVGLGLGFAIDRLTGVTAPWGLIVGVLLGFAVSVWMAKKTADRLTAQAAAETSTAGPAQSVPPARPGEGRDADEDD